MSQESQQNAGQFECVPYSWDRHKEGSWCES